MKKEKFIQEVYSNKKNQKKKELIAFVVSVHYTEDGKRKNHKKRFRVKDYSSPSAAKAAAVAYRNEVAITIVNKKMEKMPTSYTVNDLMELVPTYFPFSMGTIEKDNKVFDAYVKPNYGTKKLTEIQQIDVQNTLVDCASKCVAQHVRNLKSVWHKIFQVGIQLGITTIDLTQRIKTPKSYHVTERSLGEQNIAQEDFDAFCEALEEYGHYMPEDEKNIYNRQIILYAVKLMRVSGVRSQEVRALKRECIQIAADQHGHEVAYIHVHASIGSTYNEKNVVRTTKTVESVRTIPIYGEAVDMIRELLGYSKYDLIFSDYEGKPFSSTEFADYLRRVSESCGIKVYATLLRKSFSADMYRAGVNPAVIKKLMGHKSENMSLNWYATAQAEDILSTMQMRTNLYKKKAS